jgi:hypothetical protein
VIDIAKHRELEAKATPGPWESRQVHWGWQIIRLHENGGTISSLGNLDTLINTVNSGMGDADLIATLRNDHEAMLAELEAARECVKMLRQAYNCDAVREWFDEEGPAGLVALEKYDAATKGEL